MVTLSLSVSIAVALATLGVDPIVLITNPLAVAILLHPLVSA